jgi:tRNA (guanine37-N1)-methyltransferase
MKIDVVTIFPELFESFLKVGLLGKSVMEGKLQISIHNLRDYTTDRHHQVDDYPYGGGRGMIFMIEPLYNAYESLRRNDTFMILMSADGKLLTNARTKKISKKRHILIFCGRYEGIDERFKRFADMEISIGRYVVYGGEIPAMVLIEGVTRFLPNILDSEVVENETYSQGNLSDFPQYSRPREFKDMKVPEVLLNGNHKEIAKWREKQRKKI